MRKGLIRRVAGRGRRGRSAASASGSTITDATGKRYRFVPVNEADETAFADPPRRWGRVGLLAGGWAIVLALGAWIAPGFAASGSSEDEDPRDETPTTAESAAWSYLRYGSNDELNRAEAVLCEGASPEVTVDDLDAIRESYADQLGGISRIDLQTDDPVPALEGSTVSGTVEYIYEDHRRLEDFVVSVQEQDAGYCVSNAVRLSPDEPSASGNSPEVVDPRALATDFLGSVVGGSDLEAAASLQCVSYSGISPEDLSQAISDWEAQNGEAAGYLTAVQPAESTESSITMFDAAIELDAGMKVGSFTFLIGVQGDCIASLEGGEGLIDL